MAVPGLKTQLRQQVDCACLQGFLGTSAGIYSMAGPEGLIRWLHAREAMGLARCSEEAGLAEELEAAAWQQVTTPAGMRRVIKAHEARHDPAQAEARAAQQRQVLAEREQQRRQHDPQAELRARLQRQATALITTTGEHFTGQLTTELQTSWPTGVGQGNATQAELNTAGGANGPTNTQTELNTSAGANRSSSLTAEQATALNTSAAAMRSSLTPEQATAVSVRSRGRHNGRRPIGECGQRIGAALDVVLADIRAWDFADPDPMPEFPWELAIATLEAVQAEAAATPAGLDALLQEIHADAERQPMPPTVVSVVEPAPAMPEQPQASSVWEQLDLSPRARALGALVAALQGAPAECQVCLPVADAVALLEALL